MMKFLTHAVTISVTFDKRCSEAHARRSVRACIHGEFYPAAMRDDDPERFRVSSQVWIVPVKGKRRKGKR